MTLHHSFSSAGERAGLAAIATAGLSSALCTFTLLAYILWNAFLTREQNTPLHRGIRSFTCSSLGCYFISLLFCDFLQGASFALNYRWAALGGMKEGRVCTIQGAVSEVGDLGAAIWSIAIGIHTFFLLFIVKKPHHLMAPIILGLGWTMLIVLPILGPTVIQTSHRGLFYSLSGAWCWIGTGYNAERLIYLYIWVFTAIGSSFIIYTLIYLRFSNFITVGENGNLTFSFRRRHNRAISQTLYLSQEGTHTSQRASTKPPGRFGWAKDVYDGTATTGTASASDQAVNSSPVSKDLRQVARRLMWYPILYTLVVSPVSVCRMGVIAGWQPPFGLLVLAGICFGGSGVSNVILFITTRHSFIKRVAKDGGTRILVTTHRGTVRDDSAPCPELDEIATNISGHSLATPISPCFPSFEGVNIHVEGIKEKTKEQNCETDIVDGSVGLAR
ncbi:hypothetical protein JB92DRAFT_810083 [Gautieria morchelliformis]|nr:hypothetical protein JB92DRAFT_810083 [Gautieria morchelliformis]